MFNKHTQKCDISFLCHISLHPGVCTWGKWDRERGRGTVPGQPRLWAAVPETQGQRSLDQETHGLVPGWGHFSRGTSSDPLHPGRAEKLVHVGEKLVIQGFIDLDSLPLCGARATNISGVGGRNTGVWDTCTHRHTTQACGTHTQNPGVMTAGG